MYRAFSSVFFFVLAEFTRLVSRIGTPSLVNIQSCLKWWAISVEFGIDVFAHTKLIKKKAGTFVPKLLMSMIGDGGAFGRISKENPLAPKLSRR